MHISGHKKVHKAFRLSFYVASDTFWLGDNSCAQLRDSNYLPHNFNWATTAHGFPELLFSTLNSEIWSTEIISCNVYVQLEEHVMLSSGCWTDVVGADVQVIWL